MELARSYLRAVQFLGVFHFQAAVQLSMCNAFKDYLDFSVLLYGLG